MTQNETLLGRGSWQMLRLSLTGGGRPLIKEAPLYKNFSCEQLRRQEDAKWKQRHTGRRQPCNQEEVIGVIHLQTKEHLGLRLADTGKARYSSRSFRWVKHHLASTLISDFESPKVWEINFSYLKPPRVWYFARAGVENECSDIKK